MFLRAEIERRLHSVNERLVFVYTKKCFQDRFGSLQKLCTFLHVQRDDATLTSIIELTSFESMKTHKDNFAKDTAMRDKIWSDGSVKSFYRKGIVGDWVSEFTEESDLLAVQAAFEKTISKFGDQLSGLFK